jgi:hypothetical protein
VFSAKPFYSPDFIRQFAISQGMEGYYQLQQQQENAAHYCTQWQRTHHMVDH